MHQFDFTIGDEPYKRDWSDRECACTIHLAAVTIQGAMAAPMIAASRQTKRFIKQTPIVWQSYLKLGRFCGLIGRRDAGAPRA